MIRRLLVAAGDLAVGGLAHLLFRILGLLPIGTASALGGRVARAIGPRIGASKRARRNLVRAFPERSPAEIEAIVADVWDNLGRTVAEFPHLTRLRAVPDGTAKRPGEVELVGWTAIDAERPAGRPILFVSAHLANWEVLTAIARAYDQPLNVVYRPANNRWVESLYRKARLAVAESVIPKGAEGARMAIQALRAGRHLGMLVDQKMNDGIAVPFFGRPAMTASAPAELALRYDAVIIPAQMVRLPGARFRMIMHPPLTLPRTGDRHADVLAVMTQINAMIESWIRAQPGQWLWLHKRWPD